MFLVLSFALKLALSLLLFQLTVQQLRVGHFLAIVGVDVCKLFSQSFRLPLKTSVGDVRGVQIRLKLIVDFLQAPKFLSLLFDGQFQLLVLNHSFLRFTRNPLGAGSKVFVLRFQRGDFLGSARQSGLQGHHTCHLQLPLLFKALLHISGYSLLHAQLIHCLLLLLLNFVQRCQQPSYLVPQALGPVSACQLADLHVCVE
mmetsp:Transcript_32703/g.64060  ORF Transcript_32703/g.64060 Transcript_32703/m.64060 type:complete len:200 (-) Transcript_32703:82-681(-)